jgi:hypothetical protein
MTQMLERAGEALQAAWYGHADLPAIDFTPAERVYLARAALEAMLEPGDEVVYHGMLALSNNGVDDVRADDALACWQAMIRKALAEG